MKQTIFDFLNYGLESLPFSERKKNNDCLYKGKPFSDFPCVLFKTKRDAITAYRKARKKEEKDLKKQLR